MLFFHYFFSRPPKHENCLHWGPLYKLLHWHEFVTLYAPLQHLSHLNFYQNNQHEQVSDASNMARHSYPLCFYQSMKTEKQLSRNCCPSNKHYNYMDRIHAVASFVSCSGWRNNGASKELTTWATKTIVAIAKVRLWTSTSFRAYDRVVDASTGPATNFLAQHQQASNNFAFNLAKNELWQGGIRHSKLTCLLLGPFWLVLTNNCQTKKFFLSASFTVQKLAMKGAAKELAVQKIWKFVTINKR